MLLGARVPTLAASQNESNEKQNDSQSQSKSQKPARAITAMVNKSVKDMLKAKGLAQETGQLPMNKFRGLQLRLASVPGWALATLPIAWIRLLDPCGFDFLNGFEMGIIR